MLKKKVNSSYMPYIITPHMYRRLLLNSIYVCTTYAPSAHPFKGHICAIEYCPESRSRLSPIDIKSGIHAK